MLASFESYRYGTNIVMRKKVALKSPPGMAKTFIYFLLLLCFSRATKTFFRLVVTTRSEKYETSQRCARQKIRNYFFVSFFCRVVCLSQENDKKERLQISQPPHNFYFIFHTKKKRKQITVFKMKFFLAAALLSASASAFTTMTPKFGNAIASTASTAMAPVFTGS